MYFVYLVYCKITGEIYVGKTCNPKRRWSNHKALAISDTKRSIKERKTFQNSIREYGIENFSFKVVEKLTTESDSFLKEKEWIKALKELGCPLYNGSSGGEGKSKTFKLQERDILRIKFLLKCKLAGRTIAKWFGITGGIVSMIKNNQLHNHIIYDNKLDLILLKEFGFDSIQSAIRKNSEIDITNRSKGMKGKVGQNKGKKTSIEIRMKQAGENAGQALLTEEIVKNIKSHLSLVDNENQLRAEIAKIAKENEVTTRTIRRIYDGKTWRFTGSQ